MPSQEDINLLVDALNEAVPAYYDRDHLEIYEIEGLARKFAGNNCQFATLHFLKCSRCFGRWVRARRNIVDQGIKMCEYSSNDIREMLQEVVDEAIKRGVHQKIGITEEVYRTRVGQIRYQVRYPIRILSDKEVLIVEDLSVSGISFKLRNDTVVFEGTGSHGYCFITPDNKRCSLTTSSKPQGEPDQFVRQEARKYNCPVSALRIMPFVGQEEPICSGGGDSTVYCTLAPPPGYYNYEDATPVF